MKDRFKNRQDIAVPDGEKFVPLTSREWHDFENLFGKRGACGGCWCMYWRLRRKEFDRQKGDGNRQAIKTLVERGEVPGILAYRERKAVGWCAVAPRESFPVLENSRILRCIDDQAVWSVVCFFIEKHSRYTGLTVKLLQAAIQYVRLRGGKIVEGYPVEPPPGKSMPAVFAYTGLATAFLKAGFREVARRSPTRPIMRYDIDSPPGKGL